MPVTFTFDVAEIAAPAAVATPTPQQIQGETAIRDIALTTVDGDLELLEGDLVFLAGVDAIVSDVRSSLQLFLGEWFLDLSVGFPWFQEILGVKPFRPPAVKDRFRKAILAVPGVAAFINADLTFDGETRQARGTFAYRVDTGEVITETLGLTFGGS